MSDFLSEIKAAFPNENHLEIAKRLVDHFGGQQLYIPKRIDDKDRDTLMFEDFTGNNIKELCRKYSLSEQHVYKIIRQQRHAKLMKT